MIHANQIRRFGAADTSVALATEKISGVPDWLDRHGAVA